MPTTIVDYQRYFQIWLYTVGHGLLLLRSTKSETIPTRVDVLFTDVSNVCLPTVFNGLIVSKVDEPIAISELLGTVSAQKGIVYKVSGEGYSGYVIASAVVWHEDHGSYDDPSKFNVPRAVFVSPYKGP